VPVGDPALEKLEFTAGYINEQLGDVDSERLEATAGLTQTMGHWQRGAVTLKLNDERSGYPDGTRDRGPTVHPPRASATPSLPPKLPHRLGCATPPY